MKIIDLKKFLQTSQNLFKRYWKFITIPNKLINIFLL